MYVVVDPNAVEFAMPDREGAFSMTVPPGEYTFKAFFDGKQVGKPVDGVHVGARASSSRSRSTVGGGDSK